MHCRWYHAPFRPDPDRVPSDVRLSKLKLAGFKTFVDPTTIQIPGNLVGVVGPNGCGKSNIIDAVRWVLGESRASALRGESMQDVIFNGSTTRKPVSRASVELVFDNHESRVSGQWARFSEISVKRVLDRSGESTYLINNLQVRRKDVIDLFLGTGLGPRAYAIIEQGMISRIIEARPEEIRSFLEEAAGVTRYRERRRETEGRLADARDNLARLDDICSELGERITHLDAQARVAIRYRELNDAHRSRQQVLWLLKRNEARNEQDRLRGELHGLSQRLELDNERLLALETEIETAREAHHLTSAAVQEAQNLLFAASAEVTRLESEIRHLQDARRRVLERLGELEREQTHWRERQEGLSGERSRWSELLDHARLRMARAEAGHAECAERLSRADASFREAEGQVERARHDLTNTEQLWRVAETQCASASRALESVAQRRQRIENDAQGVLGPDPQELERQRESVATLEVAVEATRGETDRAQLRFTGSQTTLRDALEHERAIQRQLTELRARHDALSQLQQRVQAQGGLGDWLRRHALADLPPLWRVIEVRPGWELALEAVLRERLSALDGGGGRAVAALLDADPPESLALILNRPTAGMARAEDAGQAGWHRLIDLLEIADPAHRAVLADWLQGWFAVESVVDWIDQRELLEPGVRLVDRRGRTLERGLLQHFSPDARTHGVIERQREIDQLSEQRERMETEFERVQQSLALAQQDASSAQEAIERLRRRMQDTQQQLHGAQVAALRLEQEHQRAIERNDRLARDLADLAHHEAVERAHLEAAERDRHRHDELAALQREVLDSARQIQNERSEQLRESRALEQAAARELQEAAFAERECTGRIEEIERTLALARVELTRIADERGLRERDLEASNGEDSQRALDQALTERSLREASLAACRTGQEEAAQHLRQCEEMRLRIEQDARPVRERVGELRLSLQAAELAAAQFEERLRETGADEAQVATLLDVSESVRENVLVREIARLGREITELGHVNLAALDELSAAQQRKSYLDAQHTDLTAAIETLEDAIRRIDRETREQLRATYETVSRHFSALFPQLFGGGQAQLLLTGDEILDAGIQILAQPPGKKNTSIHLLSGGEKALTAIALVFAMFQLNPAPFCMLDEVDAPLDDANTERYCQMVRRMTEQTQFIFISHSKVTMEIARHLIGVTMQERGVSRVVEVDIEEALRMAEAAVA